MGKKLRLEDLKIQSFVTHLGDNEKDRVLGGGAENTGTNCDTLADCTVESYCVTRIRTDAQIACACDDTC